MTPGEQIADLLRRHQYGEAANLAVQLARRAPGDAGIQALAARALYEIGELVPARSFLERSIGLGNQASGDGSVAIGDPNFATGEGAIAIGRDNIATGNAAIALGDTSSATGTSALAAGRQATANGNGAIAVGDVAQANAPKSVAIGAGAQAGHANSVAIGSQVQTVRDDQILLGATRSTYTLAGVSSNASRAAQQGAVRLVTADSLGNLATTDFDIGQFNALGTRVGAIEGQILTLSAGVDQLRSGLSLLQRQSNGGTAAAMALGGTVMPADLDFSLSFNLATYRGEQGFSAAAVAKVRETVWVSGGLAGSTVKGSTGGRVGVTFGW